MPGSGAVHALPARDTFDSSLDGWTHWGTTSEYVLDRQSEGAATLRTFAPRGS